MYHFTKNHHLFLDGSEEEGKINQINYYSHMLCFVYLAKENHNSGLKQLLSGALCAAGYLCLSNFFTLTESSQIPFFSSNVCS